MRGAFDELAGRAPFSRAGSASATGRRSTATAQTSSSARSSPVSAVLGDPRPVYPALAGVPVGASAPQYGSPGPLADARVSAPSRASRLTDACRERDARAASDSSVEQSQLEHARGVEPVDSQRRTAAAAAAARRHQADELGPDHLRPARRRLASIRPRPSCSAAASQSSTFMLT